MPRPSDTNAPRCDRGAMASNHVSTRSATGLLARVVGRAAAASARRPRRVIAFWLVLVVGCVAAGAVTGTQSLTGGPRGRVRRRSLGWDDGEPAHAR